MTRCETWSALKMLADGGVALLPQVEYALEDRGLIVQDHEPYARLTPKGRALLADLDTEFGVAA